MVCFHVGSKSAELRRDLTKPAITNLPVTEPPTGQEIALTVKTIDLERAAPETPWTFKSKFRIVLSNDTGKAVDVLAPDWIAVAGDVPLQRPLPNFCCLQAQRATGAGWDGEAARLHVCHGDVFRLWIGFDQSYPGDDLKRRSADRHLGTLVIPVKIDDRYVEFRRRF